MANTTIEQARQQGIAASRVEGPDSQMVYNPYDPDAEAELYDAWDEGFNHDGDIYGEIASLGI